MEDHTLNESAGQRKTKEFDFSYRQNFKNVKGTNLKHKKLLRIQTQRINLKKVTVKGQG